MTSRNERTQGGNALQEPFGNMSTEVAGEETPCFRSSCSLTPASVPLVAEPQGKPEEVHRGQTRQVRPGTEWKRAENGSAGGVNK